MMEELNRRDQEIESKNRDIEKLRRDDGASSGELEHRGSVAERKLQQGRADLSNLLEKGRTQIDQDAQAKLAKHRRELIRQIEDQCETFRQEVKKYLRQRNDAYRKMVSDLVDMSLNRELERLQKELNEVIQALNEEGGQRDKKLQQAHEQIDQLNDLIGRGIDLESELDQTMEDHLEQEEL